MSRVSLLMLIVLSTLCCTGAKDITSIRPLIDEPTDVIGVDGWLRIADSRKNAFTYVSRTETMPYYSVAILDGDGFSDLYEWRLKRLSGSRFWVVQQRLSPKNGRRESPEYAYFLWGQSDRVSSEFVMVDCASIDSKLIGELRMASVFTSSASTCEPTNRAALQKIFQRFAVMPLEARRALGMYVRMTPVAESVVHSYHERWFVRDGASRTPQQQAEFDEFLRQSKNSQRRYCESRGQRMSLDATGCN